MHDSEEEEEQTALVCDNGTFFFQKKNKKMIYTIQFIREKYYFIEFKPEKWNTKKTI